MLWGTGSPRRELLHVDDLADACLLLMNMDNERFRSLLTAHNSPVINIGCGKDQTIRELAELVAKVVGFDGDIEWDSNKPGGTSQKLLDVSRLAKLGWEPRIALERGLNLAYRDYVDKSQR
jgi:GDP-L-fucose synthase